MDWHLQSLGFPQTLAEVLKLSPPQIDLLADNFLSEEILIKDEYSKTDFYGRDYTLKIHRLVVRLLTEAHLSGVISLSRLVDQDYTAGNAFVALLAEVGRISPESFMSGSFEVHRPIAIRAMARSFHCPYETMRRALRRLSQLELADLREDGVVLKPGAIERPDVQAYLNDIHDITVTLVDDLYNFAKLPVPQSSHSACPEQFIKLASLDLHLLAVEGMQNIFLDFSSLMLTAAITAGNIRHITYHPELAFTYAGADQVPPMSMRRPVQFKALCDVLPISPTTAWRRITAMKMIGFIKAVDGGLVVDSHWLRNSRHIYNACDRIDRMRHIIKRMALSGVPLDDVSSLYIKGRVTPVSL